MSRTVCLIRIAVLSGAFAACSRASSPAGSGSGGTSKSDGAASGGATATGGATGTGGTTGSRTGGADGRDAGAAGTGGGAGGATRGADAGQADGRGGGGAGGTSGMGGQASPDAPVADAADAAGDGTGGRGAGGVGGTGGSGAGGETSAGTGGGAGSTTGMGTGGRTSVGTGGTAGTGTGTGGQSAGGAGGTGTGGPKILWTDSIQTKAAPWGLDGYGTEHPIGTSVTPNDANGANFSVVSDPSGGSGLAIRHFATFDTGGSRSQGGLYGDVNTIFGKQAKTAEGVWVAQEWYFPEAIGANGDVYCWINLWDFHSVDADRGNRWHTSPGLMLDQDGSMKVHWEWGGPAASINQNSAHSAMAMPVGRWFDVEMHYVWSDTPTATITLWIDGQLAIEEAGVQTRASSHQMVETYLKFYGSTQGRGPWTPTPSHKYTRNVRVAGERIWR